jgi:D-lactate dehydrogenase
MLYGKYKTFFESLQIEIPDDRLRTSLSERISVSEDGGIYRYIPKLVVVVKSEREVAWVLNCASKFEIPITFRGTGSSNAGQSLTGSVLVVIDSSWKQFEISEDGEEVKVACGTTLNQLNGELNKLDRFIEFQSHSKAATIAGIISDFSFGYLSADPFKLAQCIKSLRVVLFDGTIVDTSRDSVDELVALTNSGFTPKLQKLQRSIRANEPLCKDLAEKQRIITSGYQLAPLVEEDNLIQLIQKLMLGASGTLGFISEVTLKTTSKPNHIEYGIITAEDSEWLNELNDELSVNALDNAIWLGSEGVELISKAGLLNKQFGVETKDHYALLFKISGDSEKVLEAKKNYIRSFDGYNQIDFNENQLEHDFLVSSLRCLRAEFLKKNTACFSSLFLSFQFPYGNLFEALNELKSFIDAYKDDYLYWVNPLQNSVDIQIPLEKFDSEDSERLYLLLEGISRIVAVDYRGVLSCHSGIGRLMSAFLKVELNADRLELMSSIKRIFDPYLLMNPDVMMGDKGSISNKNLLSILGKYNEVNHCTTCGSCEECNNRGCCSLRKKLQLLRVMNEWYAKNPTGEQLKKLVTETVDLFDEEHSEEYLNKCPMEVKQEDVVLPSHLKELIKHESVLKILWKRAKQSFIS